VKLGYKEFGFNLLQWIFSKYRFPSLFAGVTFP
jgi:hypothetical protein